MTACAALIVAAGRGTRFGGSVPKQYLNLAGRSVLAHATSPFSAHPDVSDVRVVIHSNDRDLFDTAVSGLKVGPPIIGGSSRQESVRLGLEALANYSPNVVLIHDAARPFVTEAVISRVLETLHTHPAAIAAQPIVDTLKRSQGPQSNLVMDTVSRECLWSAQTPQGFHFPTILQAHHDLANLELTDDASLAERAGIPVTLVPGDEENIKLTTEHDWRRAEKTASGLFETRTGLGFDVHRFGAGDQVILCGVPIAHTMGLEGHSDADVALHALTDALLGAIGAGDIGAHFPPSEPEWRGAPSAIFLRKAADLVRETGGAIINIDLTLICQSPRIGNHRERMRNSVAELLSLSPARVSIKATTTEGLGFTGRDEGIAAQAIANVRLPEWVESSL